MSHKGSAMVSVGQGIISLGLTSLDEYPLEVQNCRKKNSCLIGDSDRLR